MSLILQICGPSYPPLERSVIFYKLKPKAKKANLSILRWAKKEIKKPIVVIGGINNLNYKRLINAGEKYIAISSFIWDNPRLKPELAIKKFK